MTATHHRVPGPARRRYRWTVLVAAVVLVVLVALWALVGRGPQPGTDAWATSAAHGQRFVAADRSEPPAPVADSTLQPWCALSEAPPRDDGMIPGNTVLSVWAHPDDDLVFMNPGIADDLQAGECVSTLFVTGGDAGAGQVRSLARQRGIMAGYDVILGREGRWHEQRVVFDQGAQASIWTPEGDDRLSLTFLDLPDGNTRGQGFEATGHQTLPQLVEGDLETLQPVDGAPPVSRDALTGVISQAVELLTPDHLVTFIPKGAPGYDWEQSHPDHPDHMAVAFLTREVLIDRGFPLDRVDYLIGYPSFDLPVNLEGEALAEKAEAFRAYAEYDETSYCGDRSCLDHGRLGQWIQRHYVMTEDELFPQG